MKKTPEDERNLGAHRLAELLLQNMPELYTINHMSHQPSYNVPHKTRKAILKVIWKHKRPQMDKEILNREGNGTCIPTPDLKLLRSGTCVGNGTHIPTPDLKILSHSNTI